MHILRFEKWILNIVAVGSATAACSAQSSSGPTDAADSAAEIADASDTSHTADTADVTDGDDPSDSEADILGEDADVKADAPSDLPGSCDDVPPMKYKQLAQGDAGTIDEPEGTSLPLSRCKEVCPAPWYSWDTLDGCKVVATDAGKGIECSYSDPCTGRRPAGLRPWSALGVTSLGRVFGEAAHLEAASVVAFRVLACELRRYRAPVRLIHAARRAARDEIRHARTMRSLARRWGGAASEVNVASQPARSLEDIATENAVEGCARETWGAMVACFQARKAVDPLVRDAFSKIARDEIRHAALSWQVDEWIAPRLAPDARRRVAAARHDALQDLERSVSLMADEAHLAAIGIPDRATSLSLLSALRRGFKSDPANRISAA